MMEAIHNGCEVAESQGPTNKVPRSWRKHPQQKHSSSEPCFVGVQAMKYCLLATLPSLNEINYVLASLSTQARVMRKEGASVEKMLL